MVSELTGEYYKGQTKDLELRFHQHNSGREDSTRKSAPWRLIWFTTKDTREEALILERKLKNLTRKRLEDFSSE